MEFLGLIAFLLALAGPIGLVAALMAHRRIKNLETKLGTSSWDAGPEVRQQAAPTGPESCAPPPVTEAPPASPPVASPPIEPKPLPKPVVTPAAAVNAPTALPPRWQDATKSGKPKAPRDLESILGGQWLTWAGILALFFGTAFFLGVDLSQSALAGLPQVMIGLAVAGTFLFIGHRLSERAEKFLGLGLLGGGVALLFLGLFALYGFHHLVPAIAVLPMLIFVAVIGATLALKRDSLTIAALTLIGALITPVVLLSLSRDTATFDALLPYLMAVNLGAVLIGVRRGWAALPLGSFIATLLLVTAWWSVQPERDIWSFLAVAGSWGVFAVAPWLQREETRFWSLARAATLTANGLFFGLFCQGMVAGSGQNGQGAILFGLAVVYYTMSVQMKQRHGESAATRLAHTTSAALAVVTVPILLDMAWVTVGWTALAGVLIFSGLRERNLWQRVTGLVVLVISLFRVAIMDLPAIAHSSEGFSPILNGEFLAGLPALALLGWVFWAYHRYDDRLCDRERRARSSFLIAGTAILLWKLSAELWGFHSWRQHHRQESPAVVWLWLSLLWTAYGLGTALVGRRRQLNVMRVPGFGVLGVGLGMAVVQALFSDAQQIVGYRPLWNPEFLQGVWVTAVLVVAAWLLNRRGADLLPAEVKLRRPLLYAAALFPLLKMTIELRGLVGWPDHFVNHSHGNLFQLWLMPMWAAYGLGLVMASRRERLFDLRLPGYALCSLAVLWAMIKTIGNGNSLITSYLPLWNLPFLQGLFLTSVLGVLVWQMGRSGAQPHPRERQLRTPMILTAIVLIFLKVTMEVLAFFKLGSDATAVSQALKSQLSLSLVWGLYAGGVIWAGFARRFKPVRVLGMNLLAITVLKLFVLDMQALDKGYRIVAFVGLGVLLLVISLLYQRDRQAPEEPGN